MGQASALIAIILGSVILIPFVLLLSFLGQSLPGSLSLRDLALSLRKSLLDIAAFRASRAHTRPPPHGPTPRLSPLRNFLEKIKRRTPHSALRFPQTLPLSTIQDIPPDPSVAPHWLTSAILREANANDVRCVSWILRKIPDQEAFDTTISHAGTIRWFEAGLKVTPPYNLIACTLEACFSPTGKMYPGMRDSACYSLRAIVWIRICAMHISKEFARGFPLPTLPFNTASLDPDLRDLFRILVLVAHTLNFISPFRD